MRFVSVLVLGFCLAVTPMSAQRSTVAAADSAFRIGAMDLADSLYYVGVRLRPRDPIARDALGGYLAARGAAKVAVVLIEEARMFGGDPARAALRLAPLYQYLGDWRALLTLPGSPLSATERKRASWMAEHPTMVSPDSASVALVASPVGGDTIARVPIRIGRRSAIAAIVSSDAGFIIGRRVGGDALRYFGPDSAVAVLDSIAVGALRLGSVAVSTSIAPGAVAIGIAAFNRLSPTIDYARNRMSFAPTAGGASAARHYAVRDGSAWHILDRTGWVPLSSFAETLAQSKRAFTLDLRAGELRIRP